MKKLILTLFIFFAFTITRAQEIEYKKVIKVDSLNSVAEESLPLFDPENKTMFIVRTFHSENTGGKNSGNEIWAFGRNEQNKLIKSNYDLKKLNNKYSNAVVGIAKGGKKLYLLNRYMPDGKTKPGVSTSTLKNNQWSKPKNLNIAGVSESTNIYNVFINPSEDVMLLSMKTTTPDSSYGIFISKKVANKWNTPTPLNDINTTSSNEISPYLSNDNSTLYFASDREGGKGGYDIYKAKIRENLNSWANIENIKALNSNAFDAYFSIAESNTAYFTSTRGGGMADIYKSSVKQEILDTIPSKEITYFDENGEVISIHPYVNFEFDKYSLNKSAKVYLNAVADSLQSNKKWKVQLSGHTDSIGSKSYNQQLAKNRALSARNYLIANGISSGRITINYYGENRPTTSNETDFGRYMNRRVEISFRKPTNK